MAGARVSQSFYSEEQGCRGTQRSQHSRNWWGAVLRLLNPIRDAQERRFVLFPVGEHLSQAYLTRQKNDFSSMHS